MTADPVPYYARPLEWLWLRARGKRTRYGQRIAIWWPWEK